MPLFKAIEDALAPPPPPDDTQFVYIDLPGETARCCRVKDKITVVLRKHRDIVFDITLTAGATYRVSTDESDFYNARDKKIVQARLKQTVTFKDGERMHLWIGREFKGVLRVSGEAGFELRIDPRKLDLQRYGSEPTEKPAPLVIALGAEAQRRAGVTGQIAELGHAASPAELARLQHDHRLPQTYTPPPQAPAVSATQAAHIIEVRRIPGVEVPPEVTAFFEHGGEETAVDANGLLTRNWLLAQITGAAGYASDNQPWLKELWKEKFRLLKVTDKNAGVKYYIALKGNPALRTLINASRYGAEHSKVLAISCGAGSAAGLRHAGWEAARGTLKKAGLLALVFTMALDTAEWLADYQQTDPATGKPKRDIADLFAKLFTDVAFAVIGGVAAVLVMAGIVALAALVKVGVLVVAVAIGTVGLSIIFGLGLALIDKHFGVTDGVAKAFRNASEHLERKYPNDYTGYPKALGNLEFARP